MAALSCSEHKGAHALGIDRETPAIAGEARVGVGFSESGRMLAGHPVEELLEAGCAQEPAKGRGICVPALHVLQTRLVIQERREKVGPQRHPSPCGQGLVHIVEDEVAAGIRHERHVADARDALLGHAPHLVCVGSLDALGRKPTEDPWEELHSRRLANDACELPRRIAIVAAAHRRHAVACDTQELEGAAVEPEGVAVTGVHGAGAVGEGLIDARLGGRDRRIPQIVAPALRDDPGVGGETLRERSRALHKVGLGFTAGHEHVRGLPHRGMKEMQVGVMESGTDEGVAEVEDAG